MRHTFVRWSARTSVLRRPVWYSELACLRNACRYLRRNGSRLTLAVSDGEPDQAILGLPWDSVVYLDATSNSAAFLLGLNRALADAEASDEIYMVEQDYLHLPNALDLLDDGATIRPSSYVGLFDDPLYYWRSADTPMPPASSRIFAGAIGHWRTAPSTTMSFAGAAWLFADDMSVFERHLGSSQIPPDRSVWSDLLSKGRELIVCLPSAATHVETTALAPYVNWRSFSIAEGSTELHVSSSWQEHLCQVSSVLVTPSAAPHVSSVLGLSGVSVRLVSDAEVFGRRPVWVVVTAEEKESFDSLVRDRGSAVVGLLVVGDRLSYRGRWYSGRDWFFDDFREAAGDRVAGH